MGVFSPSGFTVYYFALEVSNWKDSRWISAYILALVVRSLASLLLVGGVLMLSVITSSVQDVQREDCDKQNSP